MHRMLGAGSYFGEIALLCHVHRTMTVRAVTHALVFVIERAHFVPLMAEYPADMNQLLLSAALRYRARPQPTPLQPTPPQPASPHLTRDESPLCTPRTPQAHAPRLAS